MSDLGRLEPVDLRQEWPSEAGHFTPWLAQDANLALLGKTLDLELELEAQERAVGPFRADILCKDVGRDQWVLVENQLERTDHVHLGQVLTYAAGLNAVTIVWIAARFTDEHRATLDWLNRITDETFNFFALEVELWRIGDSLSAPKFNIISKPNNWSRAVKQAARGIDTASMGPLQELQLAYWDALHVELNRINGPISGNRKPQPQSWMSYSIGKSGITCNASISRPSAQVRAELYISGNNAAAYRDQLFEQKLEIEEELGEALVWQEMDHRQDRKIYLSLPIDNFEDQGDWPRQVAWLAEKLNALHRVFVPRLRYLVLTPS